MYNVTDRDVNGQIIINSNNDRKRNHNHNK